MQNQEEEGLFILTINVFFSPTYYAEESHIQKILLFGLSREIHFEDKFMTTTTTILLLQKITINSPHCVTKHIPSIYLLYLLSNFLLTFIIFLSFLLWFFYFSPFYLYTHKKRSFFIICSSCIPIAAGVIDCTLIALFGVREIRPLTRSLLYFMFRL